MNISRNAGQKVATLISPSVRKQVVHTASDNEQPYADGDSPLFYL